MIDLTTPALLFPTISLLLLAYTNRFLGLAAIIRNLYNDYMHHPSINLLQQISHLRLRIMLIKWMQFLGAASLFLCTVAMFQIYIGFPVLSEYTFGMSLLLMIASLAVSLVELMRSSDALRVLLSDLETERAHYPNN